jgi:uncharacterized protein (TIGR02453 family)
MAASPRFTPKTLSFLRALKKNNDRAWFHAHRAEYETDVRGPMVAVVEQLAADFRKAAPDLVADPKRSLFRPWRDTRFSENKAPLKTNVAAVFPNRTLGRMNGAGLYFEVAPQWVWIGGGVYAPDGPQLHAIREHIAAHLRRFEAIVRAPGLKRLGGLKGEALTRLPRGFAKDHPAARYLVYKQFLGAREEAAAFATRPDFYKQLLATFTALLPLVRFLNDPLVSAQRVEKRAHLAADQ